MIMRKRRLAWLYCGCIVALLAMMVLSLKTGVIQVAWADILHAFTRYDPENLKHLVIADSRLIRTLSSVLVGAALAVAGAITQGISRNDMADSGIIGLSAGASLAISICLAVGVASYAVVVFSGILGSFLTLLLVMTITALVKQGSISLRMILSGAMVTMFLSALSQTVAIYTGKEQNLLFWTLGDISGVSTMKLIYCGPVILVGLLAALLLARHITVLATSDELAVSLGVPVTRIKLLSMVVAAVLSACSFSLAGNISFVGIMTGNFVRYVIGQDYKYVIPISALLGAILVIGADILARSIKPPTEFPVGAIIALMGVPVFLYFIRKSKAGGAE